MGASKGFDEAQRIAMIKNGAFGPMRDLLVTEGLSTVAKVSGRVVGCRFTVDWKHAPGPPPMPEELAEYSKMWASRDDAWTESKGGLDKMQEGEWAHFVGLVVDPEFGQRGIATELYRQNLAYLKSKGFKGGVAETASNFSQRAAEKNGFQRFATVDYQSYVTESGERFFAPVQSPHTTFTVWEASGLPYRQGYRMIFVSLFLLRQEHLSNISSELICPMRLSFAIAIFRVCSYWVLYRPSVIFVTVPARGGCHLVFCDGGFLGTVTMILLRYRLK